VVVDDDLAVLGVTVDRHDELGRDRIRTIKRPYRLLLELFPGAREYLSEPQPAR
jgi:hypothetical protein